MRMVFPFVPATNTAAAQWIMNQLHGFADSVVSIVPAQCAAYARMYHPAWHTSNGQRTSVRWAQVATAMQRVPHRQMQWPCLVGTYPGSDSPAQPPVLDGAWEAPSEGSLPLDVARPLWHTLAHHTTTPHDCWFAVWGGWGCLSAGVRAVPSFALPNRQFHLFRSSIAAIEASFCDPPVHHQSANLWWPDDRAWCVATEIDFMTTYVAGTDAAVAALLSCTDLEVDQVEPTDGVTWASDTINPPPAQSWT